MATKDQAIAYISRKWNSEIEPGHFRIGFRVDNGRTQLIFVKVNDEDIIIYSIFANWNDIPAKRALEAAESKELGICKIKDFYAVKHNLPLALLDFEELENSFGLTATVADELEIELVGGDEY